MATFGNTRRSYQSLMVDGKVMHANCPRCGDSSPISVNPDNGNHRIYCYTCNKYRRISGSGLTLLAADSPLAPTNRLILENQFSPLPGALVGRAAKPYR